MPIEIRELQIKVLVTAPETAPPSPAAGEQGPGNAPKASQADAGLVASCIEQVMEILHDKTER